MSNNQAQDRYDPPEAGGEQDWDPIMYNDMPDGEIFYTEPYGDPYRKVDDKSAINTRKQTTHDIENNFQVFVRI